MYCTQCGEQLADSIKFCFNCGEATQETEPWQIEAQPEPESKANSKEALYKAVVGQKNEDFYYQAFSKIDNEGRLTVTWNWPAFFFSFYWMLYRKMWYPAAGYFLAGLLLSFLAVATAGDGSGITEIDVVYLIGTFVVFPMYANVLYYNKCKELIVKARFNHPKPEEQISFLKLKGGTSNVVVVVALAFLLIMFMGIVAAIAIPAYQDYTTKAHVQSAYHSSNEITAAFTDFYERNQVIPANLEQLYITSQYIPSSLTSMDSTNGQINVSMYAGELNGEKLILTPYLDESEQLFWVCTSDQIEQRYLPSDCTQE